MKWNMRATPLDLYDMPTPTSPHHVDVRNAIEKHRAGDRQPVAMLSNAYDSYE